MLQEFGMPFKMTGTQMGLSENFETFEWFQGIISKHLSVLDYYGKNIGKFYVPTKGVGRRYRTGIFLHTFELS